MSRPLAGISLQAKLAPCAAEWKHAPKSHRYLSALGINGNSQFHIDNDIRGKSGGGLRESRLEMDMA